jgi:hypothetical protein
MQTAISSTPHAASVIQIKNPAWLLSLVSGAGIFLAPALWNGFPIVFFDTGGYLLGALDMAPYPGRSLFYGLFLWAASMDWWFFWGPVLLQSLAGLWLVHLMLRCHDLPSGPAPTAIFCSGLGLFTGISWYTSQLMPDILVPFLVLALWLLSFRGERLGRMEKGGLATLALLGILSHMSGMALAAGLAGVVVIAKVFGRRGRLQAICVRPCLAVVAGGLLLMPAVHLAVMGKAIYTPGGPCFLAAKLVQDGIAQRWLQERCPAPGVRLCGLQNRMPGTADEFLWGDHSPFQDIGGWSGTADAELSRMVRGCVRRYTGAVAEAALQAALQQMTMVATGEGLLEFHSVTRGVFTDAMPQAAKAFNAARQQQDDLGIFDALNPVHVSVAFISVLALIPAIIWGFRCGRHDLAWLAIFVLCALLGNAIICGALSGPHNRYQSRCIWLASLVAGMAWMHWRQALLQNKIWQKEYNSDTMPR